MLSKFNMAGVMLYGLLPGRSSLASACRISGRFDRSKVGVFANARLSLVHFHLASLERFRGLTGRIARPVQ